MSEITIRPLGYTITVETEPREGSIGLEHDLLPELDEAAVSSDTEAADNQVEAIARLVALHAQAGVDIEAPAYTRGVEEALRPLIPEKAEV